MLKRNRVDLTYKKGDLLKYRDWWQDRFFYGVLLRKEFIFETNEHHPNGLRINQYTVWDFTSCIRLCLWDNNYDIRKVE